MINSKLNQIDSAGDGYNIDERMSTCSRYYYVDLKRYIRAENHLFTLHMKMVSYFDLVNDNPKINIYTSWL